MARVTLASLKRSQDPTRDPGQDPGSAATRISAQDPRTGSGDPKAISNPLIYLWLDDTNFLN